MRAMWCFDVFEEAGHIVVEGDLPGCGREDVALFAEASRLVLTGRRADTARPVGRTYFQRERRSAFVSREIALPRPVDAEEAEATLCEGVLRVRLRPAGGGERRRLPIPVDAR
jgi:HSP20 family protein